MTTERRAAVSLVEREDGRVLCVWNTRYKGWLLPGGLVEDGESVAYAQRRELHEETGLETVTATLVFEGPHDVASEPGRAKIVSVYRAETAGEPRETETGCPIRWMTRDDCVARSPFGKFYEKVFAIAPREVTSGEPLRDNVIHVRAPRACVKCGSFFAGATCCPSGDGLCTEQRESEPQEEEHEEHGTQGVRRVSRGDGRLVAGVESPDGTGTPGMGEGRERDDGRVRAEVEQRGSEPEPKYKFAPGWSIVREGDERRGSEPARCRCCKSPPEYGWKFCAICGTAVPEAEREKLIAGYLYPEQRRQKPARDEIDDAFREGWREGVSDALIAIREPDVLTKHGADARIERLLNPPGEPPRGQKPLIDVYEECRDIAMAEANAWWSSHTINGASAAAGAAERIAQRIRDRAKKRCAEPEPARLDADRTARPKTEIVGVFPEQKADGWYHNADALVARPAQRDNAPSSFDRADQILAWHPDARRREVARLIDTETVFVEERLRKQQAEKPPHTWAELAADMVNAIGGEAAARLVFTSVDPGDDAWPRAHEQRCPELAPLVARIAKGRAKYPEGCTFLSLVDEAGEVAHAINKREHIERARDELLDVAAVAMRLYLGEVDIDSVLEGLVQRETNAPPKGAQTEGGDHTGAAVERMAPVDPEDGHATNQTSREPMAPEGPAPARREVGRSGGAAGVEAGATCDLSAETFEICARECEAQAEEAGDEAADALRTMADHFRVLKKRPPAVVFETKISINDPAVARALGDAAQRGEAPLRLMLQILGLGPCDACGFIESGCRCAEARAL